MAEHLKLGLKNRQISSVLEPLRILQELFFKNTKVKELLFLNQFGLKTIYDELVKSDESVATAQAAANSRKNIVAKKRKTLTFGQTITE